MDKNTENNNCPGDVEESEFTTELLDFFEAQQNEQNHHFAPED